MKRRSSYRLEGETCGCHSRRRLRERHQAGDDGCPGADARGAEHHPGFAGTAGRLCSTGNCLPAGVTAGDVTVKAGVTDISSEGSWAKVERIVRHAGYDPATQDNDLALIKLAAVGPGRKVPLAAGTEALVSGEKLEATG